MVKPVTSGSISEGAKNAVLEVMRQASDMPGRDTFDHIQRGVKEATIEWLDKNRDVIIQAIVAAHRKSE